MESFNNSFSKFGFNTKSGVVSINNNVNTSIINTKLPTKLLKPASNHNHNNSNYNHNHNNNIGKKSNLKSKNEPIIYMNIDVEPGMCQGVIFNSKKCGKCKNKGRYLVQGKYSVCYQHKNQKFCY